MSATDWRAWHADYADRSSPLSRRLATVQHHIDDWLDALSPRAVTVTSVCAGDGRDLLEVLARRSDAGRVTATLVELDPRLAADASAAARSAGLAAVDVRCRDAGTTDTYAGRPRADLVLLCGVLGNVSDHDAEATVAALPQLCNQAASVVWTRHRREPDLTPTVRRWFAEAAFDELSFTAPADAGWSVGVHRFTGRPADLTPGAHLFTFLR